ncbi:MAG: hypothetical protein EAX95_14910 [Candidatus Thorarchaeota archaeon]|nr:hypothetical protein [Candidatus Thorarchaeota archaeon]
MDSAIKEVTEPPYIVFPRTHVSRESLALKKENELGLNIRSKSLEFVQLANSLLLLPHVNDHTRLDWQK